MRLTSFTEYSLRTLLYLAMHRDQLVTIQDIADTHSISKNHLMKVVYQLGVHGYVETVRGRHGGLRLKQEPGEINLGKVVRETETDFHMAECFAAGNTSCPLSSACRLKNALGMAASAFLATLDQQTLATLLPEPAPPAGQAPLHFHPLERKAAPAGFTTG
ncbi:Rrf2 family transcriptional regulator [Pseudoduganella sp. FT55W]|uniref:Rrf2 family transcriptional regulator n=1 Tax=Duganella rivi TaxID=2666083 RepID=A0A7X4KAQ2_9BURK|nr:Rrf2 family transcriptional regulator [Duganella rivi]MYM67311.1 Rrf2 family transcriptional regulator [Duganella rivi]